MAGCEEETVDTEAIRNEPKVTVEMAEGPSTVSDTLRNTM